MTLFVVAAITCIFRNRWRLQAQVQLYYVVSRLIELNDPRCRSIAALGCPLIPVFGREILIRFRRKQLPRHSSFLAVGEMAENNSVGGQW